MMPLSLRSLESLLNGTLTDESVTTTSSRLKALFTDAITHSSYANETGTASNERLEFLGDAVLSLACVDFLYSKYPNLTEGQLTEKKVSMVNGKQLAEIGKVLKLESKIKLGNGEVLSERTLGRAVEAVIGAYYQTHGYEQTRELLNNVFAEMDSGSITQVTKNYKGDLQRWTQQQFKQDPTYRASSSGPAHQKSFTVSVYVNGRLLGRGIGTSKKNAEQEAAKTALAGKGLL